MKRRLFCSLLIFLFFSTFCSFAQTNDDDDLTLFEIDRLIRKTEYDEALNQLNIYLKNRPENFDNAQTRIKRIMNARKQYSILAEKLIDLIQTDPGNNKEIYEITAQLEKFEKHPSDQNLQFIADLKKSAEFNYFRTLFLDIQTQTAENTQNGKYIAAIEKSREGFWLYRESFDDRWENIADIYTPVVNVLSDLDSQIAAYEEKNYISKINDAVNDFTRTVNQDQYEQALEKFTGVQNALRDYNKIREAIVVDGKIMQEKFAEIQEIDSDTTDASFLPFMIRFVHGIDSIPDSGILGAIDTQWNAWMEKMNSSVYSALVKNYEKNKKKIDDNYLASIKKYAELERKVLALYGIPNTTTSYTLENPFEDYFIRIGFVENISEALVRINKVWSFIQTSYDNQSKIISQIKKEKVVEKKTASILSLYEIASTIGDEIGIKSDQEINNFDWFLRYDTLQISDWNELSEKYNSTLNNIFVQANTMLDEMWKEISLYYKQTADEYNSLALGYNTSAQNYTSGFFTKIPQNILSEINYDILNAKKYESTFNADPELDFGINYAYPDIAVKILNYNQSDIDLHIKNLTAYQNQININYENHKLWNTQNSIAGIVKETIEYLERNKNELNGLKNTSVSMVTVAQNKIIASQLAKNEADIRFREAQNALRAEDFETARRKLQDALSKYDETLNNQNDEILRQELDSKLQDLGERIAKGENEIVVREVRDLKTRAKDAYFNGRFDDAEKYLNQAKTRWAVTNVTEDEEITNLLNFVNTAISMKDGRDILPTAPQYPEMSQLLNVSYQYFDEGSRKIGEGDKIGGLADLELALQGIQKLQYVYPLNQEAAILTLRISRLKDPQKFKEEFAQRIESAKMMCKSKETRQQGYANLLDYYELDPSYKGLKELIYQTEIDIGIRQKPVDNSGENKAKKLIADAQSIYRTAGTDEKKLKSALAKLDQALALVSDNKIAINLKDEITTKIGGTTSTVLSTEDERLYQLAIQRLQNNNVVGANAIVDQLLKKSSNANSQKIKDLKNKIDARS